MANELIPNNDRENYPFCRLKLLVETFDHSIKSKLIKIKVPKAVKPTNKKTL